MPPPPARTARRPPQGALTGSVPLLNALSDASGVLGFVDGFGGDAVASLLGDAIGLIDGFLPFLG